MCVTSLTFRTYVFFSHCINEILVSLKKNSNYFSKYQRLILFVMQQVVCFL